MNPSERIAVDANSILSAVIGGKASKVFLGNFDFVTVGSVVADVEEYLPVLAEKKGLNLMAMKAILALLPIIVIEAREYEPQLKKAMELIGERDPDDAPLLALALALKCPIWSNDNDFQGIPGITVYTTAELLSIVEQQIN